jgi:hypothetical protein
MCFTNNFPLLFQAVWITPANFFQFRINFCNYHSFQTFGKIPLTRGRSFSVSLPTQEKRGHMSMPRIHNRSVRAAEEGTYVSRRARPLQPAQIGVKYIIWLFISLSNTARGGQICFFKLSCFILIFILKIIDQERILFSVHYSF